MTRPATSTLALCAVTACLALCACSDRAGEDQAAAPHDDAAFDEADVFARTDAVARSFTSTLQARLGEAMATGGPMLAVEVCKEDAPAIAAAASLESGAQVSRVSDRNRNPAAGLTPDLAPHYAALSRADLTSGKPPSEIWQSGEGSEARVNVLRAIPMLEQPCAACHGTNVAPALAAHIDQLYPQDAAMGFEPGEMRGALLVSWPVELLEE